MTWLALGLALFLGIHLTRAVAPAWREGRIARLGDKGWKGLYTAVSLAGFGLILWGFSQARQQPVLLWPRIPGIHHATAALMLVAMVLLAAAYVPRNHLKARLQHPMTLAVKVWAFAHLIANNSLADVMLFGSFLVWSILVFRAARRRPAPVSPPPTVAGTAATVVVGVALWALFAFWAHAAWLGIAPLGR
ncbi:NnrU family protein [Roseateles saccharophilus]|uniref:Putative membrane protein n=1 Tax=Roseateles saccharophilus TaxID=304 RepID=A0A4R3V3V2_ROSSA|nr:NnrU family protein [Roseateles saccharophilus]MDG0832300.1 protein NrnU [Roseateles saccharophilus]TCU96994.1 putative membrane protein [Roseateles saccharophilus]